MAPNSSQSDTTALLPDNEPDVRRATCPMCHTVASVTQSAVEAGDAWRCVRCGQHWDAGRLAAVAAYAAWTVEHDREVARVTKNSHAAALYRDPPTERLDRRP